MKDTYRHKGMRRKLVEQLRTRGIEDKAVLAAIGSIPRHFFMDKAFEELAYEDQALPIGHAQTISQPFTVAFQTALLQVKQGDEVLEIGTGSGYQAAILAALGAHVYTLERQEGLYLKTQRLLRRMGIGTVRCYLKDGYEGLPRYAPFDKIIVTAGAPNVPEKLQEQLKVGGKMVVPVGAKEQEMYQIERIAELEFMTKVYGKFRFVPFLEGISEK